METGRIRKSWTSIPRLIMIGCMGAFLALSCSSGPSKPPRKQTILDTEFDDAKLGAEESQNMAAAMGLVDDPTLNAYINAIGKRMLPFAPKRAFNYTFQIVDQSAPNAFALPGGHIYVSRGLLTLVNTEDELACVIGHEITHAAERHAAARQEFGRRMNPFSMGYMRAGQLAAYGRNQERDADRGGQLLAAKAGWNPMGMATFMQDLGAMSRFTTGWSRLPNFFDSHPSSPERAATTFTRGQNMEWVARPPIAPTHLQFLEKLSGLTIGEDPKEGIFEKTRFLHLDMDFSLRFPDGWRLINDRDVVGAIEPSQKAFIALRIEGPGDDPQAMARKVIETELLQVRAKINNEISVQIGNYPGYRIEAHIPGARTSVSMTFIAYQDYIFRIDTVTKSGQLNQYIGRGRAAVRSFRPLTKKEKGLFELVQLEIAESRRGENLAQLSARTHNKLSLGMTAVLNDIFIDTQLRPGQAIKVGRGQPYSPSPDKPKPGEDLEEDQPTANEGEASSSPFGLQ